MSAAVILISLMVVSAFLLVLSDGWRISLPALTALYVVISVLLGAETHVVMGAIQLLVGLTSVLVLFATERALPPATATAMQYVFGLPYRVIAGLFALAIAFSLADTHPFSDVPTVLNFAVYWLGALGLVMLVLARRLLAVGYALLLLEAVAHLLLTIFSQGPGLTRLLLASLTQIAISIAIAYLLVIERESEPAV